MVSDLAAAGDGAVAHRLFIRICGELRAHLHPEYAHPVRRMMERLVVRRQTHREPWASMAIDQWLITPLYMALCSMAVAVGHGMVWWAPKRPELFLP